MLSNIGFVSWLTRRTSAALVILASKYILARNLKYRWTNFYWENLPISQRFSSAGLVQIRFWKQEVFVPLLHYFQDIHQIPLWWYVFSTFPFSNFLCTYETRNVPHLHRKYTKNVDQKPPKNLWKTSGDREPFKNLLEVSQRFSNVVLFKRTTFENLKPLKNLFENLFRIFEFQDKTVI